MGDAVRTSSLSRFPDLTHSPPHQQLQQVQEAAVELPRVRLADAQARTQTLPPLLRAALTSSPRPPISILLIPFKSVLVNIILQRRSEKAIGVQW